MNSDIDVRAAARRIAGRVRHTPVFEAAPHTWFKLEHLQVSGSFKARGMFNRILAGPVPQSGVIAASGGNAGLAAAYAARELGRPAEVFVPKTAPPVKVRKLAALGATVEQHGSEYADAYAAATLRAAETGALFCHAYDDPEMVAGNGTAGLELLDQAPVDTVLVAVGGGGLIAGVTAAIGDRVRVVAVEPQTSAALHAALAAGGPVDVPVSGVAADSLGARRAGEIAHRVCAAAGVPSLLVDDDAIVAARHDLWDTYRLAVEHGTAAAYAALPSGVYRPSTGERVAILLCGANTGLGDL